MCRSRAAAALIQGLVAAPHCFDHDRRTEALYQTSGCFTAVGYSAIIPANRDGVVMQSLSVTQRYSVMAWLRRLRILALTATDARIGAMIGGVCELLLSVCELELHGTGVANDLTVVGARFPWHDELGLLCPIGAFAEEAP